MDLLSVGLRTIFYDINIAEVISDLRNGEHAYLDDHFSKLSILHENNFTLTELNSLRDYVKQKVGASDKYHWSAFFRLMPYFCKECLTLIGDAPVVEDGQLYRWRNLSMLLGEDVLVAAYLGNQFKGQAGITLSFDWPNVITHNNSSINIAMAEGVTDIHAHLMASADVFGLTWLDLMHNILNRDYSLLFAYNEPSVRLTEDEASHIPIARLIQIAAYLRVNIYDELKNQKSKGALSRLHSLYKKHDEWTETLKNTQSKIVYLLRESALKYKNGYIDYCCKNHPGSPSIYAIHYGERALLYKFFKGFYEGNPIATKLADYVFLYIIIMCRIRREFVQNNLPNGFENFKHFQNRKDKFANIYKILYTHYAIQSSFRINMNDGLETRIAPGEEKERKLVIQIPDENFQNSLWEDDRQHPTYANIDRASLTFVVHLLKKPEVRIRPKDKEPAVSRFGFRHVYRKQIDAIIEQAKNRKNARNAKYVYDIVGIDAAGNELHCPPSVFGHVYRYARERGIRGLTYHVGEDFFDLTDGLMNIYHAIVFLGLQEKNRLGHVIALGVDPHVYYAKRGFQVIANRQKMLDLLVWVLGFCDSQTIEIPATFRECLRSKADECYSAIGYPANFDHMVYFRSQLLRSDDIWCPDEGGSKWISTKLCMDNVCVKARMDKRAKTLNNLYNINRDIILYGQDVETFTFPSEIADIVQIIQQELMNTIRLKNLVIESCPTSNLRIGPIRTYDESPLLTFHEKGLNVTANTDDKGIFSTSEQLELSIIAACGRSKAGGNYPIGVVRQLVENGKKYRFKSSDNDIV